MKSNMGYGLLPGDPGRVERLAVHVQNMRTVHSQGQLSMAEGTIGGAQVVIAATGMGGPSTVRVTEELAARGITTFIRVGGAGPVADAVSVGEIVIGVAAIRHEGTSKHYLLPNVPAVATPSVIDSLVAAAADLAVPVKVGVLHTKDSFFGEVDPDSSPVGPALRQKWHAWRMLGVMASEMEAAPLFAICAARQWRSAVIVKVNDVNDRSEDGWNDDRDLCEFAVGGLRRLIDDDRD